MHIFTQEKIEDYHENNPVRKVFINVRPGSSLIWATDFLKAT